MWQPAPAPRRMPDVEAMLVDWLSAWRGDVQVITRLYSDFEDDVPLIQITRTGGGASIPGVLAEPRVDLDVYAATQVQAADLARDLQAVMPTLKGVLVAGGLVTDVAEESGPTWRPDINDRVERYGLSYELSVKPA